MKKVVTSIAVNELVLKDWCSFPADEARRLAKWAAFEEENKSPYQFRTHDNNLIIENPSKQKQAEFVREEKPDGAVKYYVRVLERGKLRKKSITMEIEAFLMGSIPLMDQFFPKEYKNTSVQSLENG